ncbi:neuropeptide-like 1 isoform X1 [Euwallacea fornicatus]|uniref:neuropeptide-like 1 isoform X1 n=2 Tax=Euwallacea fornicatus TaxID=995702 RepID=UPI00338EE038
MENLGMVKLSLWCILVGCILMDKQVNSDSSCDIEIAETLRTLINPQPTDSMQVQALRRQLLRRFQEDLDLAELQDDRNYKRNLASLAAWNNLPDEHKRNLEALARAGTWYKNPPEQSDDPNYKRSIANLAKNGQLPSTLHPIEDQKRGIEALARNGDLHQRQNLRTLLDSLDLKRNVASLARGFNFPVGGTAGFGKRSIANLAKNGDLPYVYGKRNVQSLARDGVLGKRSTEYSDDSAEKRNIQSIKAQQRTKRDADYFENEVVYQLPEDYEEMLQELASSQDVYPAEDKRFLGSLARSGWLPPRSRFRSTPEKRHVAALARLGWLPSYRSVRRFSRSGRSYLKSDTDDIVCRKDSPNGKTKNYSYSKISSLPLDNKRYLLQPAVDKILLRKMFKHPRMVF